MSTEGRGHITRGYDVAYNYMTVKQVTVTTGYTSVITANGRRSRLYLFNTATNIVIYVSPLTDVSTTNGFGLQPMTHIPWPYAGPLYGVVAAATQKVSVAELIV